MNEYVELRPLNMLMKTQVQTYRSTSLDENRPIDTGRQITKCQLFSSEIFFGKWEERKVWLKAKKRGRSGEFCPYELDDVTVLKQKESKPYFCRLMSFRISLYQSFVSCSDNFPAKSHVLYYFLGLLAVNESILFPNSLILIIEPIDWLIGREIINYTN